MGWVHLYKAFRFSMLGLPAVLVYLIFAYTSHICAVLVDPFRNNLHNIRYRSYPACQRTVIWIGVWKESSLLFDCHKRSDYRSYPACQRTVIWIGVWKESALLFDFHNGQRLFAKLDNMIRFNYYVS